MNGIPFLRTTSAIYNVITNKEVVYLYIISTIHAERRYLVSEYEIIDLYSRFKNIPQDDIDKVIEELTQEGLIECTTTRIIVGINGDVKELFSGKSKISIEENFEEMHSLLSDYKKACPHKRTVNKLLDELIQYKEKRADKYNIQDFVQLFRICYEIIYQDTCREFSAREYGQMKNFVKLYDTQTAIKVLLTFCAKHTNWTNTLSIQNMVYFKDDVYAYINLKVKKVVSRSERDTTGF